MTVLNEAADKLKGFEAGGVDYITKPLEETEVLARVKTHLQLRRLNYRLQEQNAELQSAQAALREANEALEQRVAERTNELVAANTLLQAQIAERQRAEAALVDEHNRLRTLIDNVPEQIFIKDTQGRFVLANAATVRYLKASDFAQVLHKRVSTFSRQIRRAASTPTSRRFCAQASRSSTKRSS